MIDNPENLPTDPDALTEGRRKLFNGAVINHPHLGKLTVKVTRRDNVTPPELWEVYDAQGRLAAPSAYSEINLHRILKRYSRRFYTVEAIDSENPPVDPDAPTDEVMQQALARVPTWEEWLAQNHFVLGGEYPQAWSQSEWNRQWPSQGRGWLIKIYPQEYIISVDVYNNMLRWGRSLIKFFVNERTLIPVVTQIIIEIERRVSDQTRKRRLKALYAAIKPEARIESPQEAPEPKIAYDISRILGEPLVPDAPPEPQAESIKVLEALPRKQPIPNDPDELTPEQWDAMLSRLRVRCFKPGQRVRVRVENTLKGLLGTVVSASEHACYVALDDYVNAGDPDPFRFQKEELEPIYTQQESEEEEEEAPENYEDVDAPEPYLAALDWITPLQQARYHLISGSYRKIVRLLDGRGYLRIMVEPDKKLPAATLYIQYYSLVDGETEDIQAIVLPAIEVIDTVREIEMLALAARGLADFAEQLGAKNYKGTPIPPLAHLAYRYDESLDDEIGDYKEYAIASASYHPVMLLSSKDIRKIVREAGFKISTLYRSRVDHGWSLSATPATAQAFEVFQQDPHRMANFMKDRLREGIMKRLPTLAEIKKGLHVFDEKFDLHAWEWSGATSSDPTNAKNWTVYADIAPADWHKYKRGGIKEGEELVPDPDDPQAFINRARGAKMGELVDVTCPHCGDQRQLFKNWPDNMPWWGSDCEKCGGFISLSGEIVVDSVSHPEDDPAVVMAHRQTCPRCQSANTRQIGGQDDREYWTCGDCGDKFMWSEDRKIYFPEGADDPDEVDPNVYIADVLMPDRVLTELGYQQDVNGAPPYWFKEIDPKTLFRIFLREPAFEFTLAVYTRDNLLWNSLGGISVPVRKLKEKLTLWEQRVKEGVLADQRLPGNLLRLTQEGVDDPEEVIPHFKFKAYALYAQYAHYAALIPFSTFDTLAQAVASARQRELHGEYDYVWAEEIEFDTPGKHTCQYTGIKYRITPDYEVERVVTRPTTESEELDPHQFIKMLDPAAYLEAHGWSRHPRTPEGNYWVKDWPLPRKFHLGGMTFTKLRSVIGWDERFRGAFSCAVNIYWMGAGDQAGFPVKGWNLEPQRIYPSLDAESLGDDKDFDFNMPLRRFATGIEKVLASVFLPETNSALHANTHLEAAVNKFVNELNERAAQPIYDQRPEEGE